MANYRCACEGCTAEAFWVPALVMDGEVQGVPGVARVELKFTFCDEHRKTISITDVLTDKSWKQMGQAFGNQGRQMPDRGSIMLDFRHVTYGYCH